MVLADYVRTHTTRGECGCGRCFDRGNRPDPEGHLADVFFFKVGIRGEPDADVLKELVRGHSGEFYELDILDGGEHSYIKVGGWIGDQQLALLLMGLGQRLGLWDVLTPNLLPGLPDELRQQMAGAGMVSIRPPSAVREEIHAAPAPPPRSLSEHSTVGRREP
jgi:hypothetical protein